MALYSDSGTVIIKLTSLVTPCPLERRKKSYVATVHFSFCNYWGVIVAIVPRPHSKRRQEKLQEAGEVERERNQRSRRVRYLSRSGRKFISTVGSPDMAGGFSIRTLIFQFYLAIYVIWILIGLYGDDRSRSFPDGIQPLDSSTQSPCFSNLGSKM